MKTRLTLRPGQNGTKKLVEKYGARLLAVRYLYDATGGRRLKTVELIEEELPWQPALPAGQDPDRPVLVRVGLSEQGLRDAVKSAGARWQPDRKLWQMAWGIAREMGLESRIQE